MTLSKLKWMLLDACLASCALLLAYLLRFLPPQWVFQIEMAPEDLQYIQQIFALPAYLLVRIGLLGLFRLYRGMSRFAGMHELRQIVVSVSTGTLLFLLWNISTRFIPAIQSFQGPGDQPIAGWIPLSIIVVDWMGCLVLLGGARMLWRMWQLTRFNSSAAIHNVMIIGANDVGEFVARNFLHNPQIGYRPVGFIDEDQETWGRQIHGLNVFGGVQELLRQIEKLKVEEVVVALQKPPLRFLNQVVEICETAHVGFKLVPAVSDVMAERLSISQLRAVEIEDLLGREPVDLHLEDDMNYLEGQCVMVTGAGGSIGSELCRQIRNCRPERLVLVGRGENSLYEIAMELGYNYRDPALDVVIADVQDVDRMTAVFERHRPSVVFHAAAHKHVPLMELQPGEAVKNNVIGTFNAAFLAQRHGARRFILISTDKAVNPTSVMGATKRVAEMILSALSKEGGPTSFIAVRFGNVLGSRGSVVPLFRRQIAAGGPVTVTHPDVERYFMTIPEAVNLVMQAGAIGDNGQLFILDMGQPVRIADLARRMITLSGFEPNMDIDIEFTGLRPGEKLKEELLTDSEDLHPTQHAKIYATRVEMPNLETVKGWLQRFDELLLDGRHQALLDELQAIVPEFHAPSDDPQG